MKKALIAPAVILSAFLAISASAFLPPDRNDPAPARPIPSRAVAPSWMAAGAGQAAKSVAILVFPGVQIIDFTGPYEVFGQAGMDVAAVAERPDALLTSMRLRITPAYTLANAPRPDVIVVPGGDVREAQESPAVRQWLRAKADGAEVVLSVCNGAFILARSGLLDGLQATTFAGLIDSLRIAAPRTTVLSGRRFVDNGKIVTSGGLSAGIDGSLHVVEKIYGRERARMVATRLEYAWNPESVPDAPRVSTRQASR